MMEINFDDALDTSAERIELLSKCTELQKYSSLPYIHQHIAILRALGWRVQISEHAKFDGSDYEVEIDLVDTSTNAIPRPGYWELSIERALDVACECALRYAKTGKWHEWKWNGGTREFNGIG